MRCKLTMLILSSAIFIDSGCSNNSKVEKMGNKTFIREGFKTMFSSSDFNENFIREMVDSSYIQYVDGQTMEFEEFIQHIKVLKKRTKSIEIDFKTLVEEGEIVFSNHIITATMTDNTKTVIHVIAEFRIRNKKVYYCNELTSLIDGDLENSNLGSAL